MEVRINKRARRGAAGGDSGGGGGRGADASDPTAKRGRRRGSCLSLYELPPVDEVTIPQFEELAVHRLHVLREIEKMRASGAQRAAMTARTMELCRKYGLDDPATDNASHFIVRLAYCGTENLRQWVRQQECRLFKVRFEESSAAEVQAFFDEHDLSYRPHQTDDHELRAALLQSALASGARPDRAADVQYYRVPFEEALDLVSQRRVVLRGGHAFVPREHLVNLVVNKYRAHLGKELATTYRWTQNLVMDDRVRPLVKNLSKRHAGPAYNPGRFASGQVTPAEIPELSRRSFPLCMETMQRQLKKDAHLRHEARRTYGLFLKGIGLSLDDAIKFWRDSFARKCAGDKWQRQYAYNIRHMYGKEGKRKDYTPMSCMTIVMAQVGNGEYHGCPYRQLSEQALKGRLQARGVGGKALDQILKLSKDRHYQLACQAEFRATHPGNPAHEVGNHPNAYFDESRKHYEEKEEKKKGGDGKTATHQAAAATAQAGPAPQGATRAPGPGGAAPMHVDG